MRPGITKSPTVTDAWARVTTLYNSPYSDKILENEEKAIGIIIQATAYAIQVCFANTTPTGTGHILQVGESYRGESPESISRMWVKNNVASSAGVAIITPFFAY